MFLKLLSSGFFFFSTLLSPSSSPSPLPAPAHSKMKFKFLTFFTTSVDFDPYSNYSVSFAKQSFQSD